MARLLGAGMAVFAERGYHAARVDDVVRAADTSHGTFYLYFSNKEDLLRALAVECAGALDELASQVGPIGPGADGRDELHRFLQRFFDTYGRYGPVIRAWMEDHVDDREVNRLGIAAFTRIATALGARMREAGVAADEARVSALMALLERLAYFGASRDLDLRRPNVSEALTTTVHRGWFGAAA